jgi:hypothetical protein
MIESVIFSWALAGVICIYLYIKYIMHKIDQRRQNKKDEK